MRMMFGAPPSAAAVAASQHNTNNEPLVYYGSSSSKMTAQGHSHHHANGTNNNNNKQGDHWRSVLDNMLIEFLAALFIIMAEVMYANWEDPWTQFIPALAICGALMCLKDGDCFFPDATPTVTLLMWSVGAYDNSWLQPCARIVGQLVAAGVAIGMCRGVAVPEHVFPPRGHASLFAFEALSTVIEHMGAVYLFIPMLPMVSQGRVRAKHHHETEAPELHEVMHAAVAFAGIHWGLRLSFMGEMNPLVTVARACILWHGWEEALLLLWGEAVGVLVAMVYIMNYYAPRKQRKKR